MAEEKRLFWPGIWTTTSEKKWLDKIGDTLPRSHRFTKLQLLRKYKKACQRRVNWGSINKASIINYVDLLIQKLEKKERKNEW